MKILNLTETFTHREPLSKLVSYCAIRLRQVFYVGLAAGLLLLAGAAARPVLAQAATTVNFSPVPAVIDTWVGSTTVVNVPVSNAVNIGVFSIQINYDPDIALISQWVLGSFVPEAQT